MKLINLQLFAAPSLVKKDLKTYEGGGSGGTTTGATNAPTKTNTGGGTKAPATPSTSSSKSGSAISAEAIKAVQDVINATSAKAAKETELKNAQAAKEVAAKKAKDTPVITIDDPVKPPVVTLKADTTDTPTDKKTGKKTKEEDKTEDSPWGDVAVRPGPDIETKLGITTVPKEWPKTGDTPREGDGTPIINNTDVAGVDPSDSSSYVNSVYVPSESVTKADAYLQQMLELIRGGRTSHSDRLDELINGYLSRDKFSYDPNSDMLFQNALNSAMQSGQRAMQDTMGQAAGLTGGYGSSYATTAANQAYNSYVSGAYDNLSDYYGMALDQYQMEGQDMLTGLSLVADQDQREWDRLIDSYSSQYGYRNVLSNEDYRNYDDHMDRIGQILGMQNSDYWSQVSADEWQQSFDRGVFESDRDYEYRVGQDAIENGFRERNAAAAEASAAASAKAADAAAKADAASQAATSAFETEAANIYKNTGVEGLHDYLTKKNKSDPLNYSNDVVSKLFKTITGQDFNKFGTGSTSSDEPVPTKGANEISTDKLSALVQIYDNFYNNYWASGNYTSTEEMQNAARRAIFNAMEDDSAYFSKFTDDALTQIVERVIEEGIKYRGQNYR